MRFDDSLEENGLAGISLQMKCTKACSSACGSSRPRSPASGTAHSGPGAMKVGRGRTTLPGFCN
jgi:hypothetical protein